MSDVNELLKVVKEIYKLDKDITILSREVKHLANDAESTRVDIFNLIDSSSSYDKVIEISQGDFRMVSISDCEWKMDEVAVPSDLSEFSDSYYPKNFLIGVQLDKMNKAIIEKEVVGYDLDQVISQFKGAVSRLGRCWNSVGCPKFMLIGEGKMIEFFREGSVLNFKLVK